MLFFFLSLCLLDQCSGEKEGWIIWVQRPITSAFPSSHCACIYATTQQAPRSCVSQEKHSLLLPNPAEFTHKQEVKHSDHSLQSSCLARLNLKAAQFLSNFIGFWSLYLTSRAAYKHLFYGRVLVDDLQYISVIDPWTQQWDGVSTCQGSTQFDILYNKVKHHLRAISFEALIEELSDSLSFITAWLASTEYLKCKGTLSRGLTIVSHREIKREGLYKYKYSHYNVLTNSKKWCLFTARLWGSTKLRGICLKPFSMQQKMCCWTLYPPKWPVQI